MAAAQASPPAPGCVLMYSCSWLPGQVDGIAVRMMGHTREMIRRGTKVVLVTPDYALDGKPVPEFNDTAGVERHVMLQSAYTPVYRRNMCLRLSLANFRTLVSVIRETKPEYIHATQEANTLLILAAAAVCKVKVIISMHTDVSQIMARDEQLGPTIKGMIASSFTVFGYWVWSLARPTFLTVSEQAKLNLKASFVPDSLINPEHWGPAVDRRIFRIDLDEAKVAEHRRRLTFGLSDAYLMVYVGRVTTEKDVRFLVDALERAPKNVVLALIGPGVLAEELKHQHGLQNRLFCTGESLGREEVALCTRAADCCVSASTMETIGFVALESISCGTPFLAANAQGFALHLEHGVNARLWTPDDPESFDKELATLMATKPEGSWSREAVRATMEKASMERCTDRALRAYQFAKAPSFQLIRAGVLIILVLVNCPLGLVLN